jgi:hypothetical protein
MLYAAGNPNLLPDGAAAPLLPTDVEPLNEADIDHIFSSHGWDSDGPGKTLFPASWTWQKPGSR